MLGILFDLDMTLVDSSVLMSLRSQKNWSAVYRNIPKTKLFPGAKEAIQELAESFKVGVVTSSPRKYAEKLLNYHGLDIPVIVAYHDTVQHKPAAEPFILACQKLNLNPEKEVVFSVGDEVNDILASNKAKVAAIAVTWGVHKRPELDKEGVHVVDSFAELLTIINFFCKIKDDSQQPVLFDDLIETEMNDITEEFSRFQHVCHIGHYFPVSSGLHDDFSKELLRFKENQETSIKKWARFVEKCQLPFNLNKSVFCVRLLGHNEVRYHYGLPKPLDKLGRHLQSISVSGKRFVYLPGLIFKNRKTRPLKFLSRTERENELKGVYQCGMINSDKYAKQKSWRWSFVIMDDIITSGTSMRAVANAIWETYPNAEINGFALARTTRDDLGHVKENITLYEKLKTASDSTVTIYNNRDIERPVLQEYSPSYDYPWLNTESINFDKEWYEIYDPEDPLVGEDNMRFDTFNWDEIVHSEEDPEEDVLNDDIEYVLADPYEEQSIPWWLDPPGPNIRPSSREGWQAGWKPAPGYKWALDDKHDFSVIPKD